MSDRRAGGRLLAGLAPLWPTIRTVIADAGHESRKLARQLRRDGWDMQIVKRKQRSFKVAGLTWIVERSFAWLGFNRRVSKDYECLCPDIRNAAGYCCNSLDASPYCSRLNFSHGLSDRARPL